MRAVWQKATSEMVLFSVHNLPELASGSVIGSPSLVPSIRGSPDISDCASSMAGILRLSRRRLS